MLTVEPLHGLQGLGIARQHPFAGSAWQIQLHVAVHAMNALVVTDASSARGLYRADRDTPAIRQAWRRESWCSSTST